jgi:UDP-glucose 4-epimerase
MTFLIIGSKGFIGTHTFDFFTNCGHAVFGADIIPDSNSDFYFHFGSSNIELDYIFKNIQFDVCINCSGAASVPDSLINCFNDFALNSLHVFKILDAIRRLNKSCRFINLSSAAVYGNPKLLPIKETDESSPVSPYGFHKKISEDILLEFHKIFDIQCCSIRIFSAYGVGLRKQLLWDLYQKAKEDVDIHLFGTGEETRDFIHVSDIVNSIDLIIQKGNFEAEIYNVANGKEIKIIDIAKNLLNEIKFKGKLNFSGKTREGDPINWRADISKINKLGYRPKVDLKDGIKEYVAWARGIE